MGEVFRMWLEQAFLRAYESTAGGQYRQISMIKSISFGMGDGLSRSDMVINTINDTSNATNPPLMPYGMAIANTSMRKFTIRLRLIAATAARRDARRPHRCRRTPCWKRCFALAVRKRSPGSEPIPTPGRAGCSTFLSLMRHTVCRSGGMSLGRTIEGSRYLKNSL